MAGASVLHFFGAASPPDVLKYGPLVLAGPEQVGHNMNDIQTAGKLLAELREAYRSLPRHLQEHVTCFLHESTLEQQNGEKVAS